MDELLEQFLVEGRELVEAASKAFAQIHRSPSDIAAIDSAFRAIHTLKGSVALFAMAPAERLLHAAENILSNSRSSQKPLDRGRLNALIAATDQIDRWIDDMESLGALGADAAHIASRLEALFEGDELDRDNAVEAAADDAWIAVLKAREAEEIVNSIVPLYAFQYTPDPDCFFRGEDPLLVVSGVPELVALSVLPVSGAWPVSDAIEPFICYSVIEGLSSASSQIVRSAFRMQPNQVRFAQIPYQDEQATNRLESDKVPLMRVEAARIEALAENLGELIVAIHGLTPLSDEAQMHGYAYATSIRTVQAAIERATGKLHYDLNRLRLVPLEPALRRLPRVAREAAASLGKAIELQISGERIEVDKQIADGLFEPLLHLLRNAIDHGIELPSDRKAMGKPAYGKISLTFSREGDRLIVKFGDDGRGIDSARLRKIATARGLLSEEMAEGLNDEASLRLIFMPGFSTAEVVSDISGRGVGMDAVRSAVEKLRGTIDIESKVGGGTIFRLQLPANALTTRLLVIEVGSERYGVDLAQILETIRVDPTALMAVGKGTAIVLRGKTIPVLDLSDLIEVNTRGGKYARLLITRLNGVTVGFRVDGFSEQIETIVRPASGLLANARGVTGSAVLSDGEILLVLDLMDLAS